MNRSSKIFISAALLAAGYGVASLMGSPHAPYLSYLSNGRTASLDGGAAASRREFGDAASPQFVGGVRLLPNESESRSRDSSASSVRGLTDPQFRTLPPASEERATGAPATEAVNKAPQLAIVPTLEERRQIGVQGAARPDPLDNPEPTTRAKRKDMPPRPIWIDEPGGLPITQPAPTLGKRDERAAINAGPYLAELGPLEAPGAATRSDETSATKRTAGPPETTSDAAVVATGSQNVAPANAAIWNAGLSRSPMPNSATLSKSPAPAGLPRTHIIADGDSLPKLASRYLRDPRRANEIYALNRSVLASPELLPIGAELQIPANVKAIGRDD